MIMGRIGNRNRRNAMLIGNNMPDTNFLQEFRDIRDRTPRVNNLNFI